MLLAIGLFIVSCDSDKPMQIQTCEFEATNLVQALAVTFQQGIVAAQAGRRFDRGNQRQVQRRRGPVAL